MKYMKHILFGVVIFTLISSVNMLNVKAACTPGDAGWPYCESTSTPTTPPSTTSCGKNDLTSESECSTCCQNKLPSSPSNWSTCEETCKTSFKQSTTSCGKNDLTSESECSTCCQNKLPSSPGNWSTCEETCKTSFKQSDENQEKPNPPQKPASTTTADPNDDQFYKPLGGGDYVCGGLMSAALRDELVKIYRTVTLIMVVAVIIFGMMDFFKAVSAGDADTMKKVTKTFTNRIIIVILIATLPILLDILLTLFGNESMKNCLNYF